MSPFISHIPAAGLMEIPPLSKVMPLPTTMSGASSACPAGACSRMIRRGSLTEPAATAANAPCRGKRCPRVEHFAVHVVASGELAGFFRHVFRVRLLAGVLARLACEDDGFGMGLAAPGGKAGGSPARWRRRTGGPASADRRLRALWT